MRRCWQRDHGSIFRRRIFRALRIIFPRQFFFHSILINFHMMFSSFCRHFQEIVFQIFRLPSQTDPQPFEETLYGIRYHDHDFHAYSVGSRVHRGYHRRDPSWQDGAGDRDAGDRADESGLYRASFMPSEYFPTGLFAASVISSMASTFSMLSC